MRSFLKRPFSEWLSACALLLLPILIGCDGGGGKENPSTEFSKERGVDQLPLQRIADSISGYWKVGGQGGRGVRYRFGGNLQGSKNAYSYKGDKRTGTSGNMVPVRLERIDGEPAIRTTLYGQDTSYIRALGPDRMVLGWNDAEQLYFRHKGVRP